jgi:cyclopropane-fatty-acyl-phospholipid synthase
MIARALFDQVLGRLTTGGVIVHYWDGKTKTYGPDKPYFEVTIHHPRVLRAMLRNLSLGFGEAYMDGSLEIKGDILKVSQLAAKNQTTFKPLTKLSNLRPRQPNRPRRQRSQIAHHYDLGNDFYKLWLDESMTYSCAYFRHESDNLELAQNQKVDHVLRKLQLKKGQTLLDIGCGWGKLLIAAAQQNDVHGYGITLSEEQFKLAQERVAEAGLENQITIELLNYQDLAKRDITFDRIVSVGMYEHVGRGNHATYFRAIDKLLAPGGLSVLHTITNAEAESNDAWIDKYIFPGGYIPAAAATLRMLEAHGFELADYENLRFHYALTLEEWLRRYERHKAEVINRYDEQFYRMWRFYLANSATGFRYGSLSLSQFTFSRAAQPGLPLTREHLYESSPS